MNTHEKIWREALNLFSVKGFEAVSVRDIAGAVGIKESSLYNHYKNKQDIFDTIIRECWSRTDEQFHSIALLGDDRQWAADEQTVGLYADITPEQLTELALHIFDYIFTDETNVKMRRMLTLEQYRSDYLTQAFRQTSFDAALDYQSALFAGLMHAGSFVEADPYMVAMAFFAPIFLIFYKYDNTEQGLQDAREMFKRHLSHFIKMYSKNGGVKQ